MIYRNNIKKLIQVVTNNRFIYFLPQKDSVALTFDDGPILGNTEKILCILNKHKVKCTFFVNGKNAEKYPDLIKQIYNKGHSIGNHGFYHMHCKRSEIDSYINNVISLQNLLNDILPEEIPKLYRPPYGEWDYKLFYKLIKMDYRMILWSFDPGDSFKNNSKSIIGEFEEHKNYTGNIILLHEDNSNTIETLENIILFLKNKHLSIESL